MRTNPTRAETGLLVFCLLLLSAALVAPPMAQPGVLHDFADHRPLWGIPCALDVLSNLPFALAGLFGLFALRQVQPGALSSAQKGCATLFFAGLLCTAAASSYYHWTLTNFGLAVDRAGMSIAFAGLLGLLAAAHVSNRAGRTLAPVLLVLALASVAAWFATGNVVPWAVVQFGGMPLLLLAAFHTPREGALRVRWLLVVAAYAAAKLFEMGDHLVWQASGELFSGHTIKHLAAAFAAGPVIAAVLALPSAQNAPDKRAAPLPQARRA